MVCTVRVVVSLPADRPLGRAIKSAVNRTGALIEAVADYPGEDGGSDEALTMR